MKKTLVVLLALVMVFSFAATAMAADTQYVPYSDIADQDDATATAIERLSVLGALKGYNAEGTIYAPNNFITREEFATVAVRVAGLEDGVALYAAQAPAFNDIEDGRWSEGYINCAAANDIMVGRDTGDFDPTANVTMQEVVTVLLRAAGYTDALPGSWPLDYSIKALALDLDETVTFIGPKNATRADVAALVNAVLEISMVDYDSENDEFDVLATDLLAETFGATVVSITFEDTAAVMSEFSAWGFVDFATWELEVIVEEDLDPEAGVDHDLDLATLYGISDGADLTDLGWQTAALTKVGTEVAYIDLTSTVTRTAEADEAYAPTYGTLAEDSYGELWYDVDSAVYAAKDFAAFDGAGAGVVDIVTDVADDAITTEAPVTIDLDDDVTDEIFYLQGEGFIAAADLQVNDVIFTSSVGAVDAYYVIRPVAGTLAEYNATSITVDDVVYDVAAVDASYASLDNGAVIAAYDEDDNFDLTVMWAPSYAFINFAYLYDNTSASYGILDSYVYKNSDADTRLGGAPLADTILGMNVLLPGVGMTTIDLATTTLVSAAGAYPEEGSLVDYDLNNAGEFIAWNASLYDWDSAADSATATWNEDGNLVVDSTVDDTYSFAADAEIFLVESDELVPANYGFASATCLTYEEFMALGDITAAVDFQIVAANGVTQIQTLYVSDLESGSAGTAEYGFGYYAGVKGYDNVEDVNYVMINDAKVIVSVDAYNDVDLVEGLIAYKITDGVIDDKNGVAADENDFFVIKDAATAATFNGTPAWVDEYPDFTFAGGTVTVEYDATAGDIKLAGVTLFTNSYINGIDLVDMVATNNVVFVYNDADQLLYAFVEKTVTVGALAGGAIAATVPAPGRTYAVTTEYIADGELATITWYTDAIKTAVGAAPAGIAIAPAAAVASDALTLNVTVNELAPTVAGDSFFTVTIDEVESAVKTLTITP